MKQFLAIILLALIGASATAQVALNERITLDVSNTVVLRGPIDDTTAQACQFNLFMAAMKRGNSNRPLYLVLDSPGGSIDAGLALIEFAKTIPNLHTITLFGASMASAIVEHLPGERLITQTGTLMFHRAYGGFRGQFETGELESRLYAAKRMVLGMERVNAGRMRMRVEDYKGLVKDELWLDAEQSKQYRAADRIVDVACTPTLIKDTETVDVPFIFGLTVQLTFSKCPLFRAPISGEAKNKYQAPTLGNYKQLYKGL